MDNVLTHELRLGFSNGAITEEKYLELRQILEESLIAPFELENQREGFPSVNNALAVQFNGNQVITIRTLPENADALDEAVEYWLAQVPAGERIVEGSMIYIKDGKAYKV